MLLHINQEVDTPLYIQIYQQIKDKIHKNELTTNQKLASKRQLAKLNHVSENTVLNAYNQLLTEGYIYSAERRGYFVADVNLQYDLPVIKSLDVEEPKEVKPAITYDLIRLTPDKEMFPFSIFPKLYRSLYQDSYEELLNETNGQGLEELREALQHYLVQSRDVPCTKEQIILGPSGEYLLSVLLQIIDFKPTIGVEDPGYTGFRKLFDRFSLDVAPIPVDAEGICMNALRNSTTDLMITTSNHQFPTGVIMPLKRRQELLDWADEKENRYIIEDDYDSEIKYSGVPVPSLKFLDKNNKVIHSGSFTRVVSPGIRISYMVLPEPLLEKYKEKFADHSPMLSTSIQLLVTDFINEGHFATHLNRSRTFYKKKRDYLMDVIWRYDPGAIVHGEYAGLHVLVTPSFSFDGRAFKTNAREEGIKLNLLSDFSYSLKRERENVIFLSFSHIPKEEIEKVVKKLFEIAKNCPL